MAALKTRSIESAWVTVVSIQMGSQADFFRDSQSNGYVDGDNPVLRGKES